VSAVYRSGVDIERMLHVETADVQLDGKAAVTKGLPVRLAHSLTRQPPPESTKWEWLRLEDPRNDADAA
jgi:hypothetical protein